MLPAMLLLSLIHMDLTPHLPSLAHAERLPPVPAVTMALQANDAYTAELRRIRAMAPPWDEDNIDAAMGEALALRHAWELIGRAHGLPAGCWRDVERREALNELQELMGPRAWMEMGFIPAIPHWRLPRAD